MKRMFCSLIAALMLFLYVGCQSSYIARASRTPLDHLILDHEREEEFAAYYQDFPNPSSPQTKGYRGFPSRWLSPPLGYRRGQQPCNT